MPSRCPSPERPWLHRSQPIQGLMILRFSTPESLPATPPARKKDPLQRKESDGMEPSGLEPLTPCMPCRCSTS